MMVRKQDVLGMFIYDQGSPRRPSRRKTPEFAKPLVAVGHSFALFVVPSAGIPGVSFIWDLLCGGNGWPMYAIRSDHFSQKYTVGILSNHSYIP